MLKQENSTTLVISDQKKKEALSLKEEGNKLAGNAKYEEALKKYDAAVNTDPYLAAAWLNKGLMHKNLMVKNGKVEIELALNAFDVALGIDPEYTKAKHNRVECLLKYEKYSQALQELKTLKPWDGGFSTQKIALSRFTCEQQVGDRTIFGCVDIKFTKDEEIKILEFGIGTNSGYEAFQQALGVSISDLLMKQFRKSGIKYILDKRRIPTSLWLTSKGETLVFDSKETQDITTNFVFDNKILTHKIIDECSLGDIRPKCKIYKREYHDDLAETIIEAMPKVDRFVLKVPDSSEGRGVIMVEKVNLPATLKLLIKLESLLKDIQAVNHKEINKLFNNYFKHLFETNKIQLTEKEEMQIREKFYAWNTSDSDSFLVEEYITSKPIYHKKKSYDAVIRVVFMVNKIDDEFQCEPFACCWKLPVQATTEKSSDLHKRTLVSTDKYYLTAVAVEKSDEKIIYETMRKQLPKIIDKMITFDICQYLDSISDNYTRYLQYLIFAGVLTPHKKYKLAKVYIAKAIALFPNLHSAYFQYGNFYFQKNNYDKAIEYCTQAINKSPKYAPSYYIRGMASFRLGNSETAEKDFLKTVELDNSFETRIFLEKLTQMVQPREEIKTPSSTFQP